MNATQGNPAPDRGPNGAAEKEPRRDAGARLNDYEKRQRELWQLTFLVLLIVSSAFAWLAWGRIRSEHLHLEVLPAALLVLVALLGVYVWRKTHEIAELKGLVRGLDHRDGALPSEGQIDQLFQMISKSQQGFRDLIDSFDDVLIAMSLEGEIRAVNRSFSDLVGLPFQQIIGLPLAQFLENANGSRLAVPERALARFLERRQWSGIVELRVKGRNSVHVFECVAHAMIRDDQVHGLTVLARDVTAMRRSEARFTELFETLQEGIYIVTPDDIVLEVNPALVRILGYHSKEELLGKKVSEIFVDRDQRAAITREVNRQPSPESREITLFRKDGQPVICLNTATAVRDTSGRIVRYQGALVDITERRAIEKRLYQQQEFARRLVDSFPDLILVVDANRHYTFVSPKVEEVLGYSNKEVVGMVFGDRTYPEEQGRLLALFDDLVTGRQSFGSIEIQVRHMNGTWRKLRCHFSPFFDVSGKIEGVVISGRDVTEMKRLEEQLIQAEKLAAMGQMLAGVAHELNNPLTAILGASELLRDRQGVDDSTKRQLEMTHRQARRAARIVQNLLEFSRPASPQKKQLDLNGIIDRTLQLHEHSLRRNSIEVDFQPASTPPVIVGDANQLIQVFLNLVTNAEQAIGEVRSSGHIQIRVGQAGSRVFVTVQDDGVGIKAETLPRLFDPFFTTKRPGGGTGLGLSICMSIAREHGGDIEAETVPGGGAAFTVFLPASAQLTGRRPPREVDTGSGQMMAPTASLKGRSLLVLDDEESIRMLLSESLSGHGLKVDTAATAEQALSLILANKYDAVLCDLKLAGTGANSDGYGVAQRLKIAAGANKPEVIFMSGDVSGDDGGMAGSSPARRLQKPFRVTDVLNLLSELWMRVPSGSRK
ncbi:MAG TPA: PAS domain S-box protein [Candidatus Acidoferrum sp.]